MSDTIDYTNLGCILNDDKNDLQYYPLTNKKSTNSFYLPSFGGEKENLLYYDLAHKVRLEKVAPLNISFLEADKNKFSEDFDFFQEKISEGSIKKAVPITYQRSTKKWDYLSALKFCLYKLSENTSEQNFYAFWNYEKKEFLVGLSPEILYQKQEGKVKSLALAGTNFNYKNGDFLNDDKERNEHQWVVEDLMNKLNKMGKTYKKETQIVNAGPLQHLATELECQAPFDLDGIETTKRLHPSPALGTYPSDKIALLNKIYPDNLRMYFGAPLGVYEKNYHKVIVAIRNIQYFKGYLWIFSGCGIVKESDKDKEWQELAAKRSTVLNRLL